MAGEKLKCLPNSEIRGIFKVGFFFLPVAFMSKTRVHNKAENYNNSLILYLTEVTNFIQFMPSISNIR